MAKKPELTAEEQVIERRHSRTQMRATWIGMAASTVAILGLVLPSVTWLFRPAVIALLSEAVSAQVEQKIDDKIEARTKPLNAGFKAIIKQNVNRLRREIAELERRDRSEGLNQIETRTLADKRGELEEQQEALRAIEDAEG